MQPVASAGTDATSQGNSRPNARWHCAVVMQRDCATTFWRHIRGASVLLPQQASLISMLPLQHMQQQASIHCSASQSKGSIPRRRPWASSCGPPLSSQHADCLPSKSSCTSTFNHPSAAFVRNLAHFRARMLNGPRMTPRAAPAAGSTSNDFYAETESFEQLGLHPAVQTALQKAGIVRPSRIQEASAPVLLQGKDAVLTAETGSGKTLAYLTPIVSMLMRQKDMRQQAQAAYEAAVAEAQQRPDSDAAGAAAPLSLEPPRIRRFHALVLCPNGALCQQVINVADSLTDSTGRPLVKAAIINSSNPPSVDPPDLIVASPAGLLTLINAGRGAYGGLWTYEGLAARVKHVVMDEADLLMGRAYEKALDELLQLLRAGDRRRVEAKVFDELGISEDEWQRLPRHLHSACWKGGAPAMMKAGFRPPIKPLPDTHFGPYWRRQYIFVAATMPTFTTSDVGGKIQHQYPEAEWISSELLHLSKPNVTHKWIDVTDRDWDSRLLSVLKSDPDYLAKTGKTLVFANNTAAANSVSQLLTTADIEHGLYHAQRPLDEQRQTLAAVQSTPGAIMVCTDAAARGLDIPDVTHIVQAESAPNTIDFIHRIGRTARGERDGRVTTLVRPKDKVLVDAIRQFLDADAPLEAAFSRARSFRRKLKRYGTFVPRGVKPEGLEDRPPPPRDAKGRRLKVDADGKPIPRKDDLLASYGGEEGEDDDGAGTNGEDERGSLSEAVSILGSSLRKQAASAKGGRLFVEDEK